ncbi:MAG: hypothetical protein B0D92_01925 [Spirochaeta sp. LUC14_002_19_P3]|nr:MAG: hypothetical protein B0D92_01925 [Spirochaeta sp. LUC14_002_19_P3]
MAAVSAVAETAGYGAADYGAAGAVGKTDLSVEQMLNYALEDEYLAHAKYDVIIKEHGNIRPFSNIIHAELRHIDWVSGLMAKYGYPVPKDDSYQYAVSPLNIKASLEACVQGEIDNINMYNMFLKQKLPGDVRDLFLELRDSSENHLRAFRNNLRRY